MTSRPRNIPQDFKERPCGTSLPFGGRTFGSVAGKDYKAAGGYTLSSGDRALFPYAEALKVYPSETAMKKASLDGACQAVYDKHSQQYKSRGISDLLGLKDLAAAVAGVELDESEPVVPGKATVEIIERTVVDEPPKAKGKKAKGQGVPSKQENIYEKLLQMDKPALLEWMQGNMNETQLRKCLNSTEEIDFQLYEPGPAEPSGVVAKVSEIAKEAIAKVEETLEKVKGAIEADSYANFVSRVHKGDHAQAVQALFKVCQEKGIQISDAPSSSNPSQIGPFLFERCVSGVQSMPRKQVRTESIKDSAKAVEETARKLDKAEDAAISYIEWITKQGIPNTTDGHRQARLVIRQACDELMVLTKGYKYNKEGKAISATGKPFPTLRKGPDGKNIEIPNEDLYQKCIVGLDQEKKRRAGKFRDFAAAVKIQTKVRPFLQRQKQSRAATTIQSWYKKMRSAVGGIAADDETVEEEEDIAAEDEVAGSDEDF